MTSRQKGVFFLTFAVTFTAGFWLLSELLHTPADPETPVVEEAVQPTAEATSTQAVIGTSVENREIESYTFGTGDTDVLFVGGVHGGYEYNSIELAKAMIDEFQTTPELVPESVTVHIIPTLNPDGYAKHLDPVTNYTDAAKRFNANGVDLNRNFACKWAPTSSWRGQTVSAGTAAFSEPEAQALRAYVQETTPVAAVFWHSRANNVYASECENGILPETLALMNTYAEAGNYGKVEKFDAYPITGDAEGWLASIGIPAVTVELETRESIEWTRNIAGTLATLELFAQ